MPLLRTYLVPHPPLLIPAIGHGRESGIKNTIKAYRRLGEAVAADRPDLIIFITPHGTVYEDYIHISPGETAEGDFSMFSAPQAYYSLTYDTVFIRHLKIVLDKMGIPAGTLGGKNHEALDHGVMVPLHFIAERYPNFKAVRIAVSGLPIEIHYRFGQCLQKALYGMLRRTVIVASGDLSHVLAEDGPYGYAPEGPEFDRQFCDAMRQVDFLRLMLMEASFVEKAASCALQPLVMMAGALDGREIASDLYSYEGPFGVGYAVCAFKPGKVNENRQLLQDYKRIQKERINELRQNEDIYVRLARYTLENFIRTGQIFSPIKNLPVEMLNQRAGTFVSIKKNGQLRGCIGTIAPYRENIAEEIIGNVISAGTYDSRFDPVTDEELDELIYRVDVVSPPEPIIDFSQLDPERYGVIVEDATNRGLLLPDLDGIDTVEQQISIALQKAGIEPSAHYKMSRFEVIRHT